jgi:hypothetical protein
MAVMIWQAVTGLNYDDGKGGEIRVEVGGEVPDSVISLNRWLVDDGHVKAGGWTATAIPVVEILPSKEVPVAHVEAELPEVHDG